MKKKALALVLVTLTAVSLAAQQPAPKTLTFPSFSDSVGQSGAASTNLFMVFTSWQNSIQADLQDHETRIFTLEQQAQQFDVQNKTIANLQDQITALKTLPATPIIMHFDAESTTTAGVTVKPILAAPGGNKITLLAGQRLTYNLLVPATKSYTFSGFIGSDSSTQGSIAFHFETATANSGPMTAPGGGAWVASTTSQPMALTAGPVALTVVIDSPSITGGAFYADYFEGSAKQ